MTLLTKEHLSEIFDTATVEDLDTFYIVYSRNYDKFNISCDFDQCAFLAQILSEVGTNLIGVRENLNYACDSLDIFSYYVNNPNEAQEDGRCGDHEANQVNIGCKAYADRLGNGSVESGDGWTYRGGSYFQITGRGHYTDASDAITLAGIDATPELLAENITKTYWGLLASMAFWKLYCDHCSTIDCTTEAINYYTDSYEEREANYNHVCDIIYS